MVETAELALASREEQELDRIDWIVSAIMACGLAATDEGPQVYKGEGLLWV